MPAFSVVVAASKNGNYVITVHYGVINSRIVRYCIRQPVYFTVSSCCYGVTPNRFDSLGWAVLRYSRSGAPWVNGRNEGKKPTTPSTCFVDDNGHPFIQHLHLLQLVRRNVTSNDWYGDAQVCLLRIILSVRLTQSIQRDRDRQTGKERESTYFSFTSFVPSID